MTKKIDVENKESVEIPVEVPEVKVDEAVVVPVLHGRMSAKQRRIAARRNPQPVEEAPEAPEAPEVIVVPEAPEAPEVEEVIVVPEAPESEE